MHNPEEIQALLDKYWLGDTTLEEERSLKAYFALPVVDERFQPVAPLFQTLRQEQAVRLERSKVVPLPSRSSVRIRWAVAASVAVLLALGAWWMRRPVVSTELAAQPPVVLPAPRIVPSVVVPPAPAPLALATQAPRKHFVKTPRTAPAAIDPEAEQAMEEIKAALSLVSSKLNKGKKAALKDLNQLENMDRFLKPKSDS